MNNLRVYRQKTELSGNKFSKKVKLSSPTINNIENGKKKPSLNTAYRIVKELNTLGVECSIEQVFPPTEDYKKAS